MSLERSAPAVVSFATACVAATVRSFADDSEIASGARTRSSAAVARPPS